MCGFALLVFSVLPAQAQDCTNPNGIKGDLLFNETYDVLQGCTARGWMAFHEPAIPVPDPCTTTSTPGTLCADGVTKYAGTLSYDGTRLYVPLAGC